MVTERDDSERGAGRGRVLAGSGAPGTGGLARRVARRRPSSASRSGGGSGVRTAAGRGPPPRLCAECSDCSGRRRLSESRGRHAERW